MWALPFRLHSRHRLWVHGHCPYSYTLGKDWQSPPAGTALGSAAPGQKVQWLAANLSTAAPWMGDAGFTQAYCRSCPWLPGRKLSLAFSSVSSSWHPGSLWKGHLCQARCPTTRPQTPSSSAPTAPFLRVHICTACFFVFGLRAGMAGEILSCFFVCPSEGRQGWHHQACRPPMG